MSKITGTKADFPVFDVYRELAYLDNSATQQKPRQVLERVEKYYRVENANPLRGLYDLSVKATDAYENARVTVQKFIGAASRREIIFTRNASESLNLVAYSWGRANIGEGDEILVAISEHHSDLLPWQLLAKEKGAKLNYLDCGSDGQYTAESLKAALTPRTKVFAIAQISNVFGRLNPIKEFAAICHENGTLIVCDGAQSVPHVPVDVRDLDVDFLSFSGHKMLAPMGIGVLYGREQLLEEAGTVNVGGAVGLAAAIEYISEVGFDSIEQRENELTELAFAEMKKIPHVNILGADNAADHHGILTFTIDGVHPHDVAAVFDSENIAIRAGHHCAQPLHQHLGVQSTARMSLAFYNDEQDIKRFIAALKTVRRRMGYDE